MGSAASAGKDPASQCRVSRRRPRRAGVCPGACLPQGCQTGEPVLTLGQVLDWPDRPAGTIKEVGLEATYYFQSTHECYPCGAHAVHVAVDPDTGKIDILHYVIAEDVGHVINPLLVTGQVVGAAARGSARPSWRSWSITTTGSPWLAP